jgi:excisionase family DNA binding protein
MTTKLLTIAEFATATGYREGTVRNKIHRKEIPVVRLGRNVRIEQSTLDRLVHESRQA